MSARRLALLLAGGAAAAAAAAAGAGEYLRRRRKGEATPDTSQEPQTQTWTCACGAEYHVTGLDRHRVFWPADGQESDAILSGECPACSRPLGA
jgi:hypothetical protein